MRRASIPPTVVDRGEQQEPDYFLDWAFDEVKRIAAKSGVHSLVARTTIDLNLQNAAEESVEFHLRQFGKEYNVTEGAVVVIETNGAVRAIVGGRDYGTSQFNRATKAPAPDRLVVQALCLCHRHGTRLHAGIDHLRRADQLGQLVAAELQRAAFPAA